MSETFEMFDPATSGATGSATSLPESEAGPLPCDSPGGAMTDLAGPAPVPANLSARQAKELGLLMSGTYGPPSTTSFKSAVLQESLASKLRQRLDVNGSLEFALTWKSWDIAWGAPICALRARARPIFDSDYGGWPSPMAGSPATATYNEAGNNDSSRKTVALLAGWPTPVANDDNKTPEAHLRMKQRMGERDGSNANRTQITSLQVMAQTVARWGTPTVQNAKHATLSPSEIERDPMVLHNQVHLVGWPTPQNRDGSHGGGQAKRGMGATRHGSNLDDFALMTESTIADWTSPRPTDMARRSDAAMERELIRENRGRNLALDAFGVTTTSSPAGTEKRGVLNPAFSCWLMGFPAGWENYADSETP